MTIKLKGDQLWLAGPYLGRRGGVAPARTEACAHKAFFAVPISFSGGDLKGVLWCRRTFAAGLRLPYDILGTNRGELSACDRCRQMEVIGSKLFALKERVPTEERDVLVLLLAAFDFGERNFGVPYICGCGGRIVLTGFARLQNGQLNEYWECNRCPVATQFTYSQSSNMIAWERERAILGSITEGSAKDLFSKPKAKLIEGSRLETLTGIYGDVARVTDATGRRAADKSERAEAQKQEVEKRLTALGRRKLKP